MHDVQIIDHNRFYDLARKATTDKSGIADDKTLELIERLADQLADMTRSYNYNLGSIAGNYKSWLLILPPDDKATAEDQRDWAINKVAGDCHRFLSIGAEIVKAVAKNEAICEVIEHLSFTLRRILPAEWLADFPEWERK